MLTSSAFAEMTDPRVERTQWHEYIDIVVVALCGVIFGCDSWFCFPCRREYKLIKPGSGDQCFLHLLIPHVVLAWRYRCPTSATESSPNPQLQNSRTGM